jgi:hypothetical protein
MSILILKRKEELKVVQGGLQVYYLFSEGSGQTLNDFSGLGNHGTLGSTAGADTNDPTWATAGLSFSTDDYVMSANHVSTRPDAWTVCAALQFTAAVDDQPLIGWGPISNSRPGIYGSFLGTPFRPIIYQGASNFRYFKSNDPVNLQNGGWHFLVFRCPGTTATDIQNASLRVDGQQQVVDSTNSGGAAQDKVEFRLGALSNKYLGGALAFLTLHNRVLSTAEADQMRQFAKQALAGRVTLP